LWAEFDGGPRNENLTYMRVLTRNLLESLWICNLKFGRAFLDRIELFKDKLKWQLIADKTMNYPVP
jgi:hypothetical protein